MDGIEIISKQLSFENYEIQKENNTSNRMCKGYHGNGGLFHPIGYFLERITELDSLSNTPSLPQSFCLLFYGVNEKEEIDKDGA